MLGKLLKHEWKASWKVPTVLIGILQVMAVLAGSMFALPIWQSEMSGMGALAALVWMMFYFGIIGLSVGIVLYLAVRFYKNMYTDEGYLTHTLPVTTHQLLISKILPMARWNALAMLGIVLSLVIFGGMAIAFLNPDGMNLWETIARMIKELKESGLVDIYSMSFLGSIVFMMLVGVFSSSMMTVGSISIGQMVSKHKVLGSIGAYFAISTIVQIMLMIVMFPIMFKTMGNFDEATNVFSIMTPIYWAMGLMTLVITVVLYFVSEFILRRKLNLD